MQSMRLPLLVLVVALLNSCLDPGSTIGPVPDAGLAQRHDRMDAPREIVSPADDTVLFAGAPVVLQLCQDTIANEAGAIGQVQCSANGLDWIDLSDPFAWPANDTEFTATCCGVPTGEPFRLRVAMMSAGGETLVRSNEVSLVCLPDMTPIRSHHTGRL